MSAHRNKAQVTRAIDLTDFGSAQASGARG
jgi:hypothetical protein